MTFRRSTVCLCTTLLFATLGLQAIPPLLPPFSAITSLQDGWEPLEFPNIDRHTHYELVVEDGWQVVRATANGSASGLIARLSITPAKSLILSWRWKISNLYQAGNARKKSGDDYPARIYVAFEFQPENAGFFERAKRKAAELLFGETLPGNALNYIWANHLPEQTFLANAYTDQTVMVAVNSGDRQLGEWVTVERDLVADYRRAFGNAPPAIVGVAIMTDADNTGEQATAWYGDLILSQSSSEKLPVL